MMGTSEFQSARDCFKKAIEISPRQMATYSRLARVLHMHLSAAMEAARVDGQVSAKKSEGAAAHFERGLYLFDMGTARRGTQGNV